MSTWTELLDELLSPDLEVVRDAAMRALPLGRAPEEIQQKIIPSLERFLTIPVTFSRSPAQLLALQGEPGLSLLRTAAAQGHGAAIFTLGEFRDAKAVPYLLQALEADRSPGEAALALGKIGDLTALPAIRAWRKRASSAPQAMGNPSDAVLAEHALQLLLSSTRQT